MASSISASSTTTSITFTFTLSNPFNYDYYYEIGVTDTAFSNGASSLSYGSVKRSYETDPNAEIYSSGVGFKITTWGDPSSPLVAGRTYTFYGYARAKNGNYYQVPEGGAALSVTMKSDPTPQAAVPYDLICVKRRDKSSGAGGFYLDFQVTVPNNAVRLTAQLSKFSDFHSVTDSVNGQTLGSLTHISGNTYGFTLVASEQITTYYIRAKIHTQNADSAWCSPERISTPLKKLWLSQSYMAINDDGTYCSCYLKKNEWDGEVNADYFSYMSFEFDFGGVPQAVTHKRMGTTYTALSPPEYTAIFTATEIDDTANVNKGFALLLPGFSTTITARVRLYSYINGAYLQPVDENGNDYVAVYTLSYTVPEVIAKFDWTVSNGSATAGQTQSAYTSVTGNGYLNSFSYLVWNDIADKVKEVLDALGYSWDSTYATFANTKMSSNDTTLTAARFNSVRYNVGQHYATGIADKIRGDTVYGAYITTVVSALNSWIDTL